MTMTIDYDNYDYDDYDYDDFVTMTTMTMMTMTVTTMTMTKSETFEVKLLYSETNEAKLFIKRNFHTERLF